jgi:hypothetical protein
MKRAIFAALLACSIAALAAEQQPPVPPPAAEQPAQPTAEQASPPWMLGDRPKRRLDGSITLPDGTIVKAAQRGPIMWRRADTCYFIRTIRPVQPAGSVRSSGFMLLQSRVTGTVRQTECSNGAMQPLVPTLEQKAATEPGLIQTSSEGSR